MTFLANPQFFPAATLAHDLTAFLATKTWTGAFRPKFVVAHNTAVPTLAQWMDPAHSAKQRILGQEHYERDIMHWHSGVAFFVAPDGVWNLCDVEQDEVHCSCFNRDSFGMEMIGDFDKESFSSGPGAHVRDNAVTLLAAIHNHFGWDPAKFEYGVSGLHLHKMCVRDHHTCPGTNVSLPDLVTRVKDEMVRLLTVPGAPTAPIA